MRVERAFSWTGLKGSVHHRQYLPKGADLSGYSQDELDAIADELNDRPRQTLEWLNPIEAFGKVLHRLEAVCSR